jgi:hypothetical protein
MPIVNLNTFYEQLNDLIDQPHEYNRLISRAIGELYGTAIVWEDGVPYSRDPATGFFVSLARPIITAGMYGKNIKDTYLRIDGVPTMGEQGFLIPRKALCTGLWAKSRNADNWSLELRKNGVPISLATVNISGSFGQATGLIVTLEAGDRIQLFANGTKIDFPIAGIELSWRL